MCACQSLTDLTNLVTQYPICLKLKLQNGDLILHRIVQMGGFMSRDLIEFVIFSAMKMNNNVSNQSEGDKSIKFGGLVEENKMGRSPLAMIYGFVVHHVSRNPYHERWLWLCKLIRKVVHVQLHHKGNQKFDVSTCAFETTPLLHASLELGGCPLGLVNRILDFSNVHELCQLDNFGRSLLMIALSNKHTPAEIIIKLLQRTPVKLLQLFNLHCEGDYPLHRVLKSGIKYHCRKNNELVFVGTTIENYPQSIGEPDEILGMPPFMLAARDNLWSLDVVYCLLRTEPGALKPQKIK